MKPDFDLYMVDFGGSSFFLIFPHVEFWCLSLMHFQGVLDCLGVQLKRYSRYGDILILILFSDVFNTTWHIQTIPQEATDTYAL